MITKNNFLLFIFGFLIALAAYFYFSDHSRTITIGSNAFAIKNPQIIDEIRISAPGEELILRKQEGFWYVNDYRPARTNAVHIFLNTLSSLQVKAPVSRYASADINKLMNLHSIHVEFISANKLLKSYDVFLPEDKDNTYMRLSNHSNPFIMEIPGYNNPVGVIFRTDEPFWRDNVLFRHQPTTIQSVSVTYPDKPDASFTLLQNESSNFELLDHNGTNHSENADFLAISHYISTFREIGYQKILSLEAEHLFQDTNAIRPYITYSIQDIYGNTRILEVYLKSANKNFEIQNHKLQIDAEQFFCKDVQNEEIFLMNYHNFDPLIREFNFFLK